ncbi:MAG: SagB/ThcOx family dehydrogenase [Candidatus Bathyarchaeia archaeon]|jgi:SagB-type dehydrogenase family enzyme
MSDDFGDVFQKNTKYHRDRSFGHALSWSTKPETYKTYPVKQVPLTIDFDTKSKARLPFLEALKSRQSERGFSNEPLRLSELAFLLWTSTGIRKEAHGIGFRTVPSAGALYPIETYVAANNVDELPQGLYHYNILGNALEELKLGAFGDAIARSALGQEMCSDAAAVFVWTAVFARPKWKYRQRAYRYVYIDAGHIAQNLALSATSLGLGTCQIGAFYDDELNSLFELDGETESVIYLSVVGQPLK